MYPFVDSFKISYKFPKNSLIIRNFIENSLTDDLQE